jgi:hypothetical protein
MAFNITKNMALKTTKQKKKKVSTSKNLLNHHLENTHFIYGFKKKIGTYPIY